MKKYIIGNWKMNKTVGQSVAYCKELLRKVKNSKLNLCVCVPFISLQAVSRVLMKSNISFGAQNVYHEENGAFTGEISVEMLESLKCNYCIVGHSERRQKFNEDDYTINKKIRALLHSSVVPIICVGELLEQRQQNLTKRVIEGQVRAAVNGLTSLKGIIFAYEPVWAIGTGQTANPMQVEDVHKFIRGLLGSIYDVNSAKKIPILYGGSVNLENVKSLFKMKNVDGGLVGGASLDVSGFSKLVNSVR
jgi:triosephosphate isomerase (TIM)